MKAIATKTIIILITILLSGCEMIEYNPNEIRLESGDENTISKNLSALNTNASSTDTIRFAVLGDVQRWYDETKLFVGKINQRTNIDFVIQVGDLSDFGLPQEFKWMKEILDKLPSRAVRYLTAPSQTRTSSFPAYGSS